MSTRLITGMVTVVLLSFFSVPIGFLIYGGAGTAIGGVGLIAILILLQYPVFLLFQRIGAIPPSNRNNATRDP